MSEAHKATVGKCPKCHDLLVWRDSDDEDDQAMICQGCGYTINDESDVDDDD